MKKWFSGLKLNIKFTLVIITLVIIPIGILAGVLFYNMEQSVIKENMDYVQYNMERNRDNVETSIYSINMATQFFTSDYEMKEMLNRSMAKDFISTKELVEFYNTDMASLERLVSNNPLLYGVRIYAMNDEMQEMMPILYNYTRMEKQEWAEAGIYEGWCFGYEDNIFKDSGKNPDDKLVSRITRIESYDYGTIGIVESAMTMESMFPTLYEDRDNEWSCFIADDRLYCGNKNNESFEDLVKSEAELLENDEDINTYYKKSDHRNLIISCTYIRELGGRLFCVQDITENVSHVYYMRNVFVGTMILIMFVLMFFINLTVKSLLGQFYVILSGVRSVQKGNLDVRIADCGNDEMGEMGTQINKMLDRIQELMDENLNRELLVKNSEIRALQNQINAHFIYNVLESIKMMAEIDEKYEISDSITALGKLLRYSMKWGTGMVLVEDELEYIKNYLVLINLRFDYEITLSLNVADYVLKQEIPKMSLQPIVENAIYHGIEEMAEDTNIYIKSLVDGTDCIIEITDAGKGMTEEELDKLRRKIVGEIEVSGGKGNGIGLKNVHDRIQMAYGSEYGIQIASKEGCYTKVMIRIPMKYK